MTTNPAPDSQTWRKETFVTLASDYRYLIKFSREFPLALKVISNKVLPSTYQGLAGYILKACGDPQTKLFVMRHLIDAEFEYAKHDFTKFMREKSRLPNRVTGGFVLSEGAAYLKTLLGDLVEEILTNRTVSFEVDPEKIKKGIEENQKHLELMAQRFVDRITSKEMVESIPTVIRALLSVIAEEAEKYGLQEHIEPLVGNMLILRFVTPAIAIPEYYGTAPADCFPSLRARRNLVLVSKLIQSLANQVIPSGSEGYMKCFDQFFVNNIGRFKEYIHEVIVDPKVVTTTTTTTATVPSDNAEGDTSDSNPTQTELVPVAHKYGWISYMSGLKPREIESITIAGNYTLRELAIAHRVLHSNREMIEQDVKVTMGDDGDGYVAFVTRLDELLTRLGRPVLIGPEPYIDPERPEMKEYITEKINKRGKRQQRIIKFTNNGFVNIKRVGGGQTSGAKVEGHARLQNEVLMSEIGEYAISSHVNDTTGERLFRIMLKFDPQSKVTVKQTGYFPPSNPPAKRPPRVYDFSTQRTRDEVLGEMFELCFNPTGRATPIAFELTKVNKYGKAQTRVFKLSRDSIMNLKGQNIKTEVHFSFIEYIRADPNDECSFYMKVRDEEFVRKNVCKDKESRIFLIGEIENGMELFERE